MQTDRTGLGDLNTFNMQHGYMEALVRGYRSGFLSESEYRHLAQCETIDGIPLVQRSLYRYETEPPGNRLWQFYE